VSIQQSWRISKGFRGLLGELACNRRCADSNQWGTIDPKVRQTPLQHLSQSSWREHTDSLGVENLGPFNIEVKARTDSLQQTRPFKSKLNLQLNTHGASIQQSSVAEVSNIQQSSVATNIQQSSMIVAELNMHAWKSCLRVSEELACEELPETLRGLSY